ncbi:MULTISPECIES: DUF6083 domain-containing protein [Streptomyces]|uniref:DUF6083 domain-containing protein n=1 Tax=Streptomyces TaxID=1883 RepID=UPI00217664F3|nr:DUF6083 domain-containing protein [Streptomyces murinus]
MGASEGTPRRLGGGRSCCPHCGLPRDRVATLGHEWVMLEPDLRPLAHEVPAGHRWIELSDGRVTVYGVCPPDPFQRCRIEHRLACPNRSLPDLWPWLTDRRSENARRGEDVRRTERRHAPERNRRPRSGRTPVDEHESRPPMSPAFSGAPRVSRLERCHHPYAPVFSGTAAPSGLPRSAPSPPPRAPRVPRRRRPFGSPGPAAPPPPRVSRISRRHHPLGSPAFRAVTAPWGPHLPGRRRPSAGPRAHARPLAYCPLHID